MKSSPTSAINFRALLDSLLLNPNISTTVTSLAEEIKLNHDFGSFADNQSYEELAQVLWNCKERCLSQISDSDEDLEDAVHDRRHANINIQETTPMETWRGRSSSLEVQDVQDESLSSSDDDVNEELKENLESLHLNRQAARKEESQLPNNLLNRFDSLGKTENVSDDNASARVDIDVDVVDVDVDSISDHTRSSSEIPIGTSRTHITPNKPRNRNKDQYNLVMDDFGSPCSFATARETMDTLDRKIEKHLNLGQGRQAQDAVKDGVNVKSRPLDKTNEVNGAATKPIFAPPPDDSDEDDSDLFSPVGPIMKTAFASRAAAETPLSSNIPNRSKPLPSQPVMSTAPSATTSQDVDNNVFGKSAQNISSVPIPPLPKENPLPNATFKFPSYPPPSSVNSVPISPQLKDDIQPVAASLRNPDRVLLPTDNLPTVPLFKVDLSKMEKEKNKGRGSPRNRATRPKPVRTKANPFNLSLNTSHTKFTATAPIPPLKTPVNVLGSNSFMKSPEEMELDTPIAADEINNTTAGADADGLSFNVGAGDNRTPSRKGINTYTWKSNRKVRGSLRFAASPPVAQRSTSQRTQFPVSPPNQESAICTTRIFLNSSIYQGLVQKDNMEFTFAQTNLLCAQMGDDIDDPDCSQIIRDLDATKLAEQETMNSNYTPNDIPLDPTWKETVEINERAGGESILTEKALVRIAARLLLYNEHDTGNTKISAIINQNGTRDALSCYPKLVSACNNLRKDGCKEIAADANIVLGCLYQKQRSHKDKTYDDEEEKYFQRAHCLRPDDWRIHTMLSITYIKSGQVSFSLQSISQALHHAKSAKARFNLLQKQGMLLCNLFRANDAIDCLEQVMVEYEEFKKDLSPIEMGTVAVSQYALCSQYAESNAKNIYKKQLSHWKQAEAKRNALPTDAQKEVCWDFRDIAQMCVAKIKPEAALSHRECHYCYHITDNAMRCSVCKVAVYCSKDCQVKGWKSGHKQECAGSKATRKKVRKHSNLSAPTTLIDENILPRSLWKKANKLSKAGNPEDAVWLYLVALFLDFSLDIKSNLTEAKKAVEKCDKENFVARVLSIVTHNDNKPLEKCASVFGSFTTEDIACCFRKDVQKEEVKTFEEVGRERFSIGISYIFEARLCFRMCSMQNPKTGKSLLKKAAELTEQARRFINPKAWLTYQYELGYSNSNIKAINEGKFWFKTFVFNLNLSQKNSGKDLPIHWKEYKVLAEQRLAEISVMEQNPMLAAFV